MKVLLVTHRFPPDGVAGVERITQDLANVLARDGETVTVVTRQWSRRARVIRRWKRELMPNGVHVERLPGVPRSLERAFAQQQATTRNFEDAFAAFGPDVVHLMHPYGFSPGCIEAVLGRRVPLIVSLHDFFFACPLAHLVKKDGRLCAGPNGGLECATTCFEDDPRGAERWTLRASYFRAVMSAAAEVIAPTEYVARYFAEQGIADRPIRVIDNGVELRREPAAARSFRKGARLRLAYIGVVVPAKGVHLILDALASTDRRTGPESLVVAGVEPDRDYANRLRSTAAQLAGVDVAFAGTYERADLERLLANVDIVIVPSRVPETFSLTVREAQALGIPVVVARIGALPDAIEEAVTGWSFTPDSADSLAQLLDRLSSDLQQVERAHHATLRLRLTSVDDHADQVLDVYRQAVLAGPRREAGDVDVASLGNTLAALG
jgi:glycosyltransferase involved in cell wall biosynthesis